ncbi:UDP-glucose/GDP-mannose dehydrogenase family protein [Coxiella burnetii]|uniref:UDP-glucose 6-dehydrogenase n=1 Tax=Coxiella burnetii (strain Dugway 5J108-111) TaxID=434922 RepID=A9KFK0_COXBN|nr:UDP-glucose/GDP-mannose dehydrogenase family protein [Coxiella burnetii]ABS76890.1 UDP-glucose 6-dehydrogenase [Coxiella burnetii Dugway 5J108-111]OYK80399.1 UDP-glucose/GDP-mannose dehydrogenase family protein [Coxiella burnetii]OYK82518.1 UDP-glucose/GDP-mannose dehydrogenase family protein [Coxiella burnetii]
MKVSVYGAGYVGLVSAVCLAELGHSVCCCDVNEEKIAKLMQGITPIHEQQLEPLLQKNLKIKRIFFTTRSDEAVKHGVIQIIAVGTPSADSGQVDMRYVDSVVETLGEQLTNYAIIVTKSTVAVGTADRISTQIENQLQKRKANIEFDVVSNPEFLKEGTAVIDFLDPDRVVVGVNNSRAANLMKELYAPLIKKGRPFVVMDRRSAEFSKYVSNAFLATKISFINEMSHFAEYFEADIEAVKIALGLDSRINGKFLNPGCGFGGSCFPKDLLALQSISRTAAIPASMVNAVLEVNERQKLILYEKIRRYFNGNLQGKIIAVWGLAFKPHTDDVRSASSLKLIESLWKAGAIVQAYDPLAMENIRALYGESSQLKLCENAYAALNNADVLAIVTEWDEFKNPNFALIKDSLRYPAIFDGRNLYQPHQLQEWGFDYFAIARGGIQFQTLPT